MCRSSGIKYDADGQGMGGDKYLATYIMRAYVFGYINNAGLRIFVRKWLGIADGFYW